MALYPLFKLTALCAVFHAAAAVSRQPNNIPVGSAPCCKTCKAPAVKFFSVDVPHGPFCGETCLRPSRYPIFKLFESNLTRYRGSGPSPCAEQFTPWGTHYTTYNETVTHGVWPLTVTLDIYAPVPQRYSPWSSA